MPMVVNTWVGGRLEQLAIDARPEPNCVIEKFWNYLAILVMKFLNFPPFLYCFVVVF
jgi:hypothetical protein